MCDVWFEVYLVARQRRLKSTSPNSNLKSMTNEILLTCGRQNDVHHATSFQFACVQFLILNEFSILNSQTSSPGRQCSWPPATSLIVPDQLTDLIKRFLGLTGTLHDLTLAYSSQENAIVERVNKEVNRHLRGLVFDTLSLEHYAKCIPFVQRIINSSVNRRTNASPSSILLGNKLDLNRGILTPHLLPHLRIQLTSQISSTYRTRSSMQQSFLFRNVMTNTKSPHKV